MLKNRHTQYLLLDFYKKVDLGFDDIAVSKTPFEINISMSGKGSEFQKGGGGILDNAELNYNLMMRSN